MTMASRSPRSCTMRSVSSLSSSAWASRRATAAANNNEGKRVGKVARRGQRSQQAHSQKHQQKWVHKSVHQECEQFPTAQSCNTTPKTHWVMQARRQCDLGSSEQTGQAIHRQWVCGWRTRRQNQTTSKDKRREERATTRRTLHSLCDGILGLLQLLDLDLLTLLTSAGTCHHINQHKHKHKAQRCYIEHCQQQRA